MSKLKQKITDQFTYSNLAASESELLKWRRRNSYYYKWLEHLFRFVVRPGSRVLDVGCGCGDLLAAVEPAYGVGIDPDPAAIELAKKRFPTFEIYRRRPARTCTQ